ncbi:MAG TPA: dTMP kinase [Candidatus Borkfalkia stercoripullorum]|nr:dTMP kinase [Candidatus Borkfalkia stercoripullorum]
MKGRFIAFEGCEGAGKSTQMRLLSEYLTSRGIPHILTREPGGGQISEAIRKIILDGKNSEMTDECEALLYAAARVQHLADTVAPALARGETVLCDRYIFSSFAYQGYGRGLSLAFLKEINAFAIEKYMPDLTVFLDIPSSRAFERKHGADPDDRMEQAGEAFHKRVYQGYKSLLKEYPEEMTAVDCSGTKYETSARIAELLRSRGLIG